MVVRKLDRVVRFSLSQWVQTKDKMTVLGANSVTRCSITVIHLVSNRISHSGGCVCATGGLWHSVPGRAISGERQAFTTWTASTLLD